MNTTTNTNLAQITSELNISIHDCDNKFDLTLGDCHITAFCNTPELVEELQDYFRSYPQTPAPADIEIHLLEQEEIIPDYPWVDWAREPGKTNRKDSYIDMHDGRLLRKVKTGMVFFQSNFSRIAVGPCLKNLNQIVNFINNQYMNYLQQQGHVICHAASVSINGKGTAIAAFSGGGKSTLMLKLMDHEEATFISNDRLFLINDAEKEKQVIARGVPKLPRINPGTILNNPKLSGIIPLEEREKLQALPKAELWDLEQKYDVMIDDIYGEDERIALDTELNAILLLNWDRQSQEKPQLKKINPAKNKRLVEAIMKSPGPFYQDKDNNFLTGSDIPAFENYLSVLENVDVYEVSGGVDFDYIAEEYVKMCQ